jgi:hypothetical protein
MHEQHPTIALYAKDSPLTRKVLLFLHRKGLIIDPLREQDLILLHCLEQVWGNREILRAQLSRMSKAARLSFLETATLESKWERYAYSRFFNRAAESWLTLATVIEEIESTFLFRLTNSQINQLRTIRTRARMARYRAEKQKTGPRAIAYKAQTKK